MTDDFCKVSLTKRFMKCKSVYSDECYVMIGGDKKHKTIVEKIHKKYMNGKSFFKSIKDNQLQDLYSIISSDDVDRDDIEKILTKELCLDEYKGKKDKLHFIYNTSLNDEDTVKVILTKLCIT